MTKVPVVTRIVRTDITLRDTHGAGSGSITQPGNLPAPGVRSIAGRLPGTCRPGDVLSLGRGGVAASLLGACWSSSPSSGGLLVVVIALVAVGGVVGRLRAEPPRNIFEHDEALEFVAQALPDQLTAELSYEEVRADPAPPPRLASRTGCRPLRWRPPGRQPAAGRRRRRRRRARSCDRPRWSTSSPSEAAVRRRVVDAQLAYFEAIGAISPGHRPRAGHLGTPSPAVRGGRIAVGTAPSDTSGAARPSGAESPSGAAAPGPRPRPAPWRSANGTAPSPCSAMLRMF